MEAKRPRIFYGWWIVGATMLVGLYVGGIIVYGFTAIFEPIIDEFGWSYATVSFAASLRGAETGLLEPVVGRFVDRWGSRPIIFVGGLFTAGGLFMLSHTTSLAMFYGSFILLAVGMSACGTTSLVTGVANWFRRRLGLATGIALCGFGLGGLVLPAMVALIAHYGWRPTFDILAAGALILLLPTSLVFRHRPEDYGYLPDGRQPDATPSGQNRATVAPATIAEPFLTAREAVRTRSFWLLTLAFSVLTAANITVVTHVMPYLPGLLSKTDWDYCFGALAPRPLVLVEQKDGWPKSGFEQAVATATAAYRLSGAEKSLLALGSRDVTEDLENGTPEGLLKPLVAAARTLVPQPPPPGMIGTLDGLRSRETVDSATGIVWLVSVMDAYDQQFVDGGYRLQSWSFYNDNGAAQQGRSATPLIFKKEGDAFVLTGIGKTRVNTGGGMQTFPFEVTAGSDEVGKGYYFGWHDGDQAGTANAGVVEFDNSVQDRMSIVTLDGQLGDQKLQLGGKYRIQSEYPRTYSIQAVSKRP